MRRIAQLAAECLASDVVYDLPHPKQYSMLSIIMALVIRRSRRRFRVHIKFDCIFDSSHFFRKINKLYDNVTHQRRRRFVAITFDVSNRVNLSMPKRSAAYQRRQRHGGDRSGAATTHKKKSNLAQVLTLLAQHRISHLTTTAGCSALALNVRDVWTFH